MKRLFITGTDTGVGKTTVGCALIAAYAARGLRVGVMKPCETGDGDDAKRLIRATGRLLPFGQVCPYRFPLPASPEVAARAASSQLRLEPIVRAYDALARDSDLMVVEGAGGLLVPLDEQLMMADLAAHLDLPLLLVSRPSLGTVNHTLLTLEAARSRQLQVLGIVFSRTRPPLGPDEPSNPESIARHGRTTIFGTLPQLTADDLAAPERLAAAALQLDLDALWSAL